MLGLVCSLIKRIKCAYHSRTGTHPPGGADVSMRGNYECEKRA